MVTVEAVEEIVRMINTRTDVMAHLNALAVEIGERPAGTPAHHRAEAYIREAFQAAGLHTEDVRLDFPNWSLVDAALMLGDMPLAVDVNPFSPGCDATAPTVAMSTLPELEAAELQGKIALLYGELSRAPVFPINFAPVQFERDQAINRLLIEKRPAAVLAVNLHPWRRVHIFEDEHLPLPSATVTVEVGRELLRHLGEPVHLRIDARTEPSHVTTVVGRTAGEHAHRVVVCAHYDTKFGTPGAQDNGTGVATMLALAETLPALNLPVGLEFVAWADEEYGAHTDLAYAKRVGDGFAEMLCAVNIDGIGLLTENTTLTMLAQGEAFEKAVRGVQTGYPGVVWVDPWVQSNHFTYFSRGVPTVALSSLTWEHTHQAEDDVSWISPAKLDEAVALVADIVKTVAAQPPNWTRG